MLVILGILSLIGVGQLFRSAAKRVKLAEVEYQKCAAEHVKLVEAEYQRKLANTSSDPATLEEDFEDGPLPTTPEVEAHHQMALMYATIGLVLIPISIILLGFGISSFVGCLAVAYVMGLFSFIGLIVGLAAWKG